MPATKPLKLLVIGVSALVLTIVPALLQGHYLNRWHEPAQLTAASSRLSEFPEHFGEWEFAEEGIVLLDEVVKELGIGSYVSRIYRHRSSGAELGLLLMTGQPGPLVRHPPHICYAMQGNVPLGDAEPLTVEGENGASEFHIIRYESKSYLRGRFKAAYAYTCDGTWAVPAWPRIAYGGQAALFKMQVLGVGQDAASEPAAQIPDFLRDFTIAFEAWSQGPQ